MFPNQPTCLPTNNAAQWSQCCQFGVAVARAANAPAVPLVGDSHSSAAAAAACRASSCAQAAATAAPDGSAGNAAASESDDSDWRLRALRAELAVSLARRAKGGGDGAEAGGPGSKRARRRAASGRAPKPASRLDPARTYCEAPASSGLCFMLFWPLLQKRGKVVPLCADVCALTLLGAARGAVPCL